MIKGIIRGFVKKTGSSFTTDVAQKWDTELSWEEILFLLQTHQCFSVHISITWRDWGPLWQRGSRPVTLLMFPFLSLGVCSWEYPAAYFYNINSHLWSSEQISPRLWAELSPWLTASIYFFPVLCVYCSGEREPVWSLIFMKWATVKMQPEQIKYMLMASVGLAGEGMYWP